MKWRRNSGRRWSDSWPIGSVDLNDLLDSRLIDRHISTSTGGAPLSLSLFLSFSLSFFSFLFSIVGGRIINRHPRRNSFLCQISAGHTHTHTHTWQKLSQKERNKIKWSESTPLLSCWLQHAWHLFNILTCPVSSYQVLNGPRTLAPVQCRGQCTHHGSLFSGRLTDSTAATAPHLHIVDHETTTKTTNRRTFHRIQTISVAISRKMDFIRIIFSINFNIIR